MGGSRDGSVAGGEICRGVLARRERGRRGFRFESASGNGCGCRKGIARGSVSMRRCGIGNAVAVIGSGSGSGSERQIAWEIEIETGIGTWIWMPISRVMARSGIVVSHRHPRQRGFCSCSCCENGCLEDHGG